MHGLQTINRLNEQVQPVAQRKASEAVRYTGHQANGSGLQSHSVGDTYPAIVVGYGDGAYGVQLGTLIVPANDNAHAERIAKLLGNRYRSGGWSAAQSEAQAVIAQHA